MIRDDSKSQRQSDIRTNLINIPNFLFSIMFSCLVEMFIVVIAIPLQKTHNKVAEIFSVKEVQGNGKSDIRCSGCEGLPEKERGKTSQLDYGSITKAKERIAIYCPEI